MGEDKNPLISVLMGIHYRRKELGLLKRSVESILKQTCTDFELLIYDGGSSEEAVRLLDSYADDDHRIRLIREDGIPSDLAHKLNACLRYARGSLIARMDDDDSSSPERFERQVQYLKSHPHISFVGCNVALWIDDKQAGSRIFPEYPQVKDFYITQPFIHPTLMFRREVMLEVSGYSEDKCCLLCEDYDLLLRLYEHGFRGANLQERLFDYTIPSTAKGHRNMSHRWNETVTRWRHFRKLGLLPQKTIFVVKPLIVGLLPEKVLSAVKKGKISFPAGLCDGQKSK